MAKGDSILIAPAHTGVAFLLSWIYLLFYATTAGIEAAAPVSLMSAAYMFSAVPMVVTLLVIAFGIDKRTMFLGNITVKIITGIGLSLGTLIMVFGSLGQNLAATLIGSVITGVFSGIMGLQWIVAYRRFSMRTVIASFPTIMAVAVCVCMVLMYLPKEFMVTATIVFPIVSEIMFHKVRTELPARYEVDRGRQHPILNYLLVILPIALCFLASGFLDFFSATSNYTFAFYALAAFIPVVIAGVFIYIAAKESVIPTFLIPVCFLAVTAVPLFSMHSYLPTAQFISIGELGMDVVVFVVAIVFSDFFSIDSLKTYALARTAMTVFNSIGWYIAQFMNDHMDTLAGSQASLLVLFTGIEVLAVCLIVAIVKVQKGVSNDADEIEEPVGEGQMTSIDPGEDGTNAEVALCESPDEATACATVVPDNILTADPTEQIQGNSSVSIDVFKLCCLDITKEFDLSRREADVFELLARGYSSSRIQKELYIAQGTVNYHTRNIYAKLGVHRKQEVIDLLNERITSRSHI